MGELRGSVRIGMEESGDIEEGETRRRGGRRKKSNGWKVRIDELEPSFSSSPAASEEIRSNDGVS